MAASSTKTPSSSSSNGSAPGIAYHPVFTRFGSSTRFGEILPTCGLLLPDDGYEKTRLARELAQAPADDALLRLEIRARLALFGAYKASEIAAATTETRAALKTIEWAIYALKMAQHNDNDATVQDNAGELSFLEHKKASLSACLAILCPEKSVTGADTLIASFQSLAHKTRLGDTAQKHAMRAFSARARELTLDELAILNDEFPVNTPLSSPLPPLPSPLPTPSPPKAWNFNGLYGRTELVASVQGQREEEEEEEEEEKPSPPRRLLTPQLRRHAARQLRAEHEERREETLKTTTPPSPRRRRPSARPRNIYRELLSPGDDDPSMPSSPQRALPPPPVFNYNNDDAPLMNDDDDDDAPATPVQLRGEKRARVEDAAAPLVSPPKRPRLDAFPMQKRKVKTPTKPLCAAIVNLDTGERCTRQVRKGAVLCSAHFLRSAPSAGAYCVVCYFLAEASDDERAAMRERAKAHLLVKKSKRPLDDAKADALLTTHWNDIPKRRFFYKIEADRGAIAKCSRHRDAVWAVPTAFVPRHANPNPHGVNGREPPLAAEDNREDNGVV
jgi:hypothetical protein